MTSKCDDLPQPADGAPGDIVRKLDYAPGTDVEAGFFTGPNPKDFKAIIEPTKVGMTLKQVWENVYSVKGKFLTEYREARNETDLVIPEWNMLPDHSAGYRRCSCTTIVEMPRPNTPTTLYEAQRFVLTKQSGGLSFIVQLSAQTPQIVGGSTFRCEAMFEYKAPSMDDNITVAIYIKVTKATSGFLAIKFMATPRAMAEMTKGYKQFLQMLREKYAGEAGGGGGADEGPASPSLPDTSGDSAGGGGGMLDALMGGNVVQIAILVAVLLLCLLSYNAFSSLSALQHSVSTQNKRWNAMRETTAPYMRHLQQYHESAISGTNNFDVPNTATRDSSGSDATVPPWASVLVSELLRVDNSISWLYIIMGMEFLLILGVGALCAMMYLGKC